MDLTTEIIRVISLVVVAGIGTVRMNLISKERVIRKARSAGPVLATLFGYLGMAVLFLVCVVLLIVTVMLLAVLSAAAGCFLALIWVLCGPRRKRSVIIRPELPDKYTLFDRLVFRR